jgi:Kef-type K+ transport system membrane component KefB
MRIRWTRAAGRPTAIHCVVALACLWGATLAGQTHDPAAAHADPAAPVAFALAIFLVAARLGGHVASRFGQPAVLGELLAGVALGGLDLVGLRWFADIETNAIIDTLARIGAVILLFEVGLESTVAEMVKVGARALLVAVVGIIAPFALGWGVSALLLPDRSIYVHAFLGATLTATSVGITARVLRDLDRSKTAEARIILGAAVIDDVLGLVILAVVTGAIATADHGSSLSLVDTALVLVKALGFLVGALAFGWFVAPRLFTAASRLTGRGVLLTFSVALCFAMGYAAATIGLAPIVGAYAAGLIIEDEHLRGFGDRGKQQLELLVQPLSTILVPVFFVLMGMHVDLAAFARLEVLQLAALLTLAAIIGKQACALGVIGQPIDGLSVGIGMMPRGEVGLIFANIGLGMRLAGQAIVDQGIFSAVVIVVMVTTLVTPPALKWSFSRARTSGANVERKPPDAERGPSASAR